MWLKRAATKSWKWVININSNPTTTTTKSESSFEYSYTKAMLHVVWKIDVENKKRKTTWEIHSAVLKFSDSSMSFN